MLRSLSSRSMISRSRSKVLLVPVRLETLDWMDITSGDGLSGGPRVSWPLGGNGKCPASLTDKALDETLAEEVLGVLIRPLPSPTLTNTAAGCALSPGLPTVLLMLLTVVRALLSLGLFFCGCRVLFIFSPCSTASGFSCCCPVAEEEEVEVLRFVDNRK